MIQTLRQIRSRMRSIENTRKITRAMEMVSAAKLNRVRKTFYAFRPYFAHFKTVMNDLAADFTGSTHPLFSKRQEIKSRALCVIASDAGLCGLYNHNVIRHAESFIGKRDKSAVRIVAVGKEAFSHFSKHGYRVERSYTGLYGRYSGQICDRITADLTEMYLSGKVDEVSVAYTQFSASLKHAAAIGTFLPIEAGLGRPKHYILEPAGVRLLDSIAPSYMANRMRAMMLESFTSEHSARMLAMKMATDNAGDLISSLETARNKARQTAITKEVLEIAMSAEALKG